jgi:membrane protein implicated in regulation of membrane protease activity
MKFKRYLVGFGLIGILAFISAVYCFWLMTVPLSYDLVYVVVVGFVVSIGVFFIALIGSFILAIRLRRSHGASSNSTPPRPD